LLALLDYYEILRLLGGGGMGIVLLARDTRTGANVAVKLVRSDLAVDPQVVRRFVKEAGHLQRLKHPNIVPVLEVSDRPHGPYFVMPYFERGSLADWRGHLARPTWRGHLARPTWRGHLARPTWRGHLARPAWHGHLARPTWRGHLARPPAPASLTSPCNSLRA
jgi:serine/threonine protein kinase